jgi:hypothetical protein
MRRCRCGWEWRRCGGGGGGGGGTDSAARRDVVHWLDGSHTVRTKQDTRTCPNLLNSQRRGLRTERALSEYLRLHLRLRLRVHLRLGSRL